MSKEELEIEELEILLADLESMVDKQGRIVDDRLLSKIAQIKRELEKLA